MAYGPQACIVYRISVFSEFLSSNALLLFYSITLFLYYSNTLLLYYSIHLFLFSLLL